MRKGINWGHAKARKTARIGYTGASVAVSGVAGLIGEPDGKTEGDDEHGEAEAIFELR